MMKNMFGRMDGSCMDDIVVPERRTLKIDGSLLGNAMVESGATLICNGSCLAEHVEIESGGTFVCDGSCSALVIVRPGASFRCDGSMSDDIIDHGGEVSVSGSFLGERIIMPEACVAKAVNPLDPDYVFSRGRFARMGTVFPKPRPKPLPAPLASMPIPLVTTQQPTSVGKTPKTKNGWMCKTCGHKVKASSSPSSCAACGGLVFSSCHIA